MENATSAGRIPRLLTAKSAAIGFVISVEVNGQLGRLRPLNNLSVPGLTVVDRKRYNTFMKRLKLTQGKYTLVDDKDFEYLNQFKWAVKNPKTGVLYAIRHNKIINGSPIKGYRLLHRMIMNAPKGTEVDHKDGNGLNNQRSNLRVCTRSQNSANRPKQKNNKSGYKGVSFCKAYKNWVAYIQINGKGKNLGYFKTAQEAAKRYDLKASELFGEFARLNFAIKNLIQPKQNCCG